MTGPLPFESSLFPLDHPYYWNPDGYSSTAINQTEGAGIRTKALSTYRTFLIIGLPFSYKKILAFAADWTIRIKGLKCLGNGIGDAQLVKVSYEPTTDCLENEGKCNYHHSAGKACRVQNIIIHPLKPGQRSPDVTDSRDIKLIYTSFGTEGMVSGAVVSL